MNRTTIKLLAAMAGVGIGGAAMADAAHVGVMAKDQSVAGGTVSAEKIVADANGWLVVHRTNESMKPGPVVGHAPLRKGVNTDVAAILTEPVRSGEMLMLMLHGENGGEKTGIFEYSLGAKADGPVKQDGKLVMAVIKAE